MLLGPARLFIGHRVKNCILGPDVHIRLYASVGDDYLQKNVEMENSIVMKGARIESGKRIVDSLIGSYSTILNGDGAVPKGYRFIVGERSFAQVQPQQASEMPRSWAGARPGELGVDRIATLSL
ncbi:MAG: hypothetical protein JRN39_06600 [Nitrososphaerota archaeon]|nr:hypothetical protein [Nitrososphaerota archaeon]